MIATNGTCRESPTSSKPEPHRLPSPNNTNPPNLKKLGPSTLPPRNARAGTAETTIACCDAERGHGRTRSRTVATLRSYSQMKAGKNPTYLKAKKQTAVLKIGDSFSQNERCDQPLSVSRTVGHRPVPRRWNLSATWLYAFPQRRSGLATRVVTLERGLAGQKY